MSKTGDYLLEQAKLGNHDDADYYYSSRKKITDNVCVHEEIETFEEYYGTGENQYYKYYKCAECWEEIVPDDAERNEENEQ